MLGRAARIAFAFVLMNYEAVAALASLLGGKEVWQRR
jgi:hypothetical protein